MATFEGGDGGPSEHSDETSEARAVRDNSRMQISQRADRGATS